MLRDLQELENIKHLLQAAGEELQNYNALVEAISVCVFLSFALLSAE
jgi:hypothetical protein